MEDKVALRQLSLIPFLSIILLVLSAMHQHTVHGCRPTTSIPFSKQVIQRDLIIASNVQTDVDTAAQKCSHHGGRLASFNHSRFLSALDNAYVQDLQRIWFFSNVKTGRYMYATTKNESSAWKLAKSNSVWFFDLYKSSAADRAKIYFCRPPSSPSTTILTSVPTIQTSNCNKGWITTIYYGGVKLAPGHRRLDNVCSARDRSICWFTDGGQILIHETSSTIQPIFVPDIKVFNGERFNVSTNQWQRSDGSFFAHPRPANGTCKQTAFHYNSSWILIDMSCTELAYYACYFSFDVSAKALPCNSTSVQVQLSDGVRKIASLFNTSIHLQVKIKNKQTVIQTKNMTSEDLSLSFGNLQQRTRFDIDIQTNVLQLSSLLSNGALDWKIPVGANVALSSSTTVTTGGIPAPVNDARVVASESCVIEAPRLTTNESLIYRITASSNRTETIENFNVAQSDSGPFLNLSLQLRNHPVGELVEFQIQAVTCNGISEIRAVSGNCTAPGDQSKGIPVAIVAGSISGVVFLALLVFFIVLICRKKRNNATKSKTSVPENINTAVASVAATNPQEGRHEPGYFAVDHDSDARQLENNAAAGYVNLTGGRLQGNYVEPISYQRYQNVPGSRESSGDAVYE